MADTATEARKPRVKLVRLLILFGLVFLLLWSLAPVAMSAMVWYSAREIVHDTPEVAVMPQPLINLALADLSSGIAIEQFGYTVRFPWSKVNVRRDFKSATSLGFEGGAGVLLMNPADAINGLDAYRGSQEATMRKLVGDKAFQSRFDFFATELQSSPADMGLLHSRARNARAIVLLGLKGMEVDKGTTAIYPVSSSSVRGFQIGDPKTTPQLVRLILFDHKDREMEIILHGSKTGPGLTQEQVNGIVASVQTPV
jgi:hypothetical protein